jgi:asparagine synthase (glutamine-hydrolysing)
MTALAGLLAFGSRYDAAQLCIQMLRAQTVFGPHDLSHTEEQEAAFGRCLHRILPEDEHDRQPLKSRTAPLLLVADVRLDNRQELACELGIQSDATTLSDTDILLKALERWGEAALDRLCGDFAFALWDSDRRILRLARDPLGQRPLHYHAGDGFFAFASMPHGLHATGLIPPRPELGRAAEFVADLYPEGPASYFEGISRVEPGYILTVSPHGIRSRRFWQPRHRELRLPRREDYVEAFREQLDRSVGAMLRGAGGMVAAHLSSGYDSSAVTATAARLLAPSGGRVLAFTAAPRPGFDGPVPRGRIADESALAAATAAMHPNIDHAIIRTTGASPFALLEERHPLVQQPAGHICNSVWGSAIKQAAREAGASVLLTGQLGNYTISAGGRGQLADLIRQGKILRWWHEARLMVANSPMRWRGVFDNSFGPWVPLPLYNLLSRGFRQSSSRAGKPFLVRSPWAERIKERSASTRRNPRPAADSAALAVELLQREDSGNFRKASLAQWGIDERDPTGDRRLIEFCLSLPIDMLLRDGEKRPLARAALSDRLPPAVLDFQDRGYQTADWYEHITQDLVRSEARRLEQSPTAAAVIDFDRVHALIDAWPTEGWERQWVISEYRAGLLRALSAAHFLCSAQEG